MRFYVYMGHEIWNSELCFSKITFLPVKKVKHILICTILVRGKKVLEVNKTSIFNQSLLFYIFLPVSCVWSSWHEESECSTTCNGGTKTLKRVINQPAKNGGEDCQGNDTKVENCNPDPCPGKGYLKCTKYNTTLHSSLSGYSYIDISVLY